MLTAGVNFRLFLIFALLPSTCNAFGLFSALGGVIKKLESISPFAGSSNISEYQTAITKIEEPTKSLTELEITTESIILPSQLISTAEAATAAPIEVVEPNPLSHAEDATGAPTKEVELFPQQTKDQTHGEAPKLIQECNKIIERLNFTDREKYLIIGNCVVTALLILFVILYCCKTETKYSYDLPHDIPGSKSHSNLSLS